MYGYTFKYVFLLPLRCMVQTEYISIIIPTYNSAEWICRCLDSVIRAADAECEIIVVDDGSTDDTVKIVRGYEERDPRFCLIETGHCGCGCARKTGVENSHGDSVIFVDSDDTIAPTVIADYRRLSAPDADIIIGNMSMVKTDGSSRLTRSGSYREYKGIDFAEEIMLQEKDFRLMGKKFSRKLFDKFYWDTNIIFGGLYHRVLLLQLACAATGRVIVDPGVFAYTHYERPWSLSSMLWLRTEGIERLWQNASLLPVSKKALVTWGMNMLWNTLIQRGIPFDNEFLPAVELRALLRHVAPEDKSAFIVPMIKSRKERLKVARRLLREGIPTVPAPHLSFVITTHNNVAGVRRTVKSIMDTGFRNIEIIIVDDGSAPMQAIELNRLAIMTNVSRLKKTPAYSGRAVARAVGLNAARGFALVFLEGGDVVYPTGMVEALNHIDSGADMAFMAMRMLGRHVGYRTFDPSKCSAVYSGNSDMFSQLTVMGDIRHYVHGVIFNRKSLMEKCCGMHNVCDGLAYKAIIVANMLIHEPKVSGTSALGYGMMLSKCVSRPSNRIKRYANMATALMVVLKRAGQDDPGRLRALISGCNTVLMQTLAQYMAVPFSGQRRARRMAENMLKMPELKQLYADASAPVPDVDDMLAGAADYCRRNRFSLLRMLSGLR